MAYIPQYLTRAEHGLFTRNEAAAMLYVSAHWLCSHRDQYPPTGLLKARWYYTADDVANIRAALEVRMQRNFSRERMQLIYGRGYLSISEASRRYGIPHITWQDHMRKNKIPRPTHRIGLSNYYTVREAEAVARTILNRT